MNEIDLVKRWEEERPVYEAWGRYLTQCIIAHLRTLIGDRKLSDVLKIEPVPRTKDARSFVDKALYRKKYEHPYDEVEDKVGVRFVVLLTSEIQLVQQAIEQCDFDVSKDKDFEEEREKFPLEFSYQSDHFVVRPKRQIVNGDVIIPAGIPCEIQVRTLLQHAHSELTHDRIYKGKKEPSSKIKRNAARSMALIESADDFFVQVESELSELERPIRDLAVTAVEIYAEKIGHEPEQSLSNILIVEALAPALGANIADQLRDLLSDKPFIAARVAAKRDRHLFRQPSILLAYLGAYVAPNATKDAWPFTLDDLSAVFTDIGKSLDQY